MLNDEQLKQVTKAFGLTRVGDDADDFAGPRIVQSREPRAFITCTPQDARMSCPSSIVLSDASSIVFDKSWQITDKAGSQTCGITCVDVTFVAVDFYGSPERLFLFPFWERFNLQKIIDLLSAHRKWTEPARYAA